MSDTATEQGVVLLTTITGKGFAKVPVYVKDDGTFHAEFLDEQFVDDNLNGLRRQIGNTALAARVAMPFVTDRGNRGVIRGFHAGQRKVLVTWASGEKGTLDTYQYVYEELSDERIAEITKLEAEIEDAKARLKSLRSEVPTIAASELLTKGLAGVAAIGRYGEIEFEGGEA